MDLFQVLTIILVFFIALVIISLAKKIVKVALILAVIFIVLFLIIGGVILSDFSSLQNKLSTSPKVILLKGQDLLLEGFIDDNDLDLYSDSEIADLQKLYWDEEFDQILGDNYKVFIFSIDALEGRDLIEVNNKKVTSEELVNFFTDNTPISQITYEDLLIDTSLILDENDMRSALFAYLYDQELRISRSPVLFFKHYKEKKIWVYPESMFFQFMKVMPLGWIDAKINKLQDTVEERVMKKGDS